VTRKLVCVFSGVPPPHPEAILSTQTHLARPFHVDSIPGRQARPSSFLHLHPGLSVNARAAGLVLERSVQLCPLRMKSWSGPSGHRAGMSSRITPEIQMSSRMTVPCSTSSSTASASCYAGSNRSATICQELGAAVQEEQMESSPEYQCMAR
jgi:hypothetical protein